MNLKAIRKAIIAHTDIKLSIGDSDFEINGSTAHAFISIENANKLINMSEMTVIKKHTLLVTLNNLKLFGSISVETDKLSMSMHYGKQGINGVDEFISVHIYCL